MVASGGAESYDVRMTHLPESHLHAHVDLPGLEEVGRGAMVLASGMWAAYDECRPCLLRVAEEVAPSFALSELCEGYLMESLSMVPEREMPSLVSQLNAVMVRFAQEGVSGSVARIAAFLVVTATVLDWRRELSDG